MVKHYRRRSGSDRQLFLLILAGFVLVSYHLCLGQEDVFLQMRVLKYREPLPARNFETVDMEGNSLYFNEFRGKVVLLNFWATWCGPCKKEMVPLEVLYQRFRERGFVVLGVSLDQGGVQVVKSFVEKRGLTFPVVIDTSGKAKSIYHVTSLPTTFLIDQDGRIIGKSLGPRDWASEAAFALVESLLASGH